ncbi:efflux RND transporter periplasmic adaptor subunit [Nannocystaceae bacterium ST9]
MVRGATIAGLALLMLAGCAREDVAPAPERAIVDPGVGTIRVSVGRARLGRVDRPLTTTGMTAAWREANVRAEVGGRVLELDVDNGDLVAAGDPLLRVDGSRQRLAVSGANARIEALEQDLEFTRADLERKQALFAKGSLAKVQLDAAQLMADRAQSAIDGARIELGSARRSTRDTKIEAPIAGIVARRSVDLGDTIGPGAPLLDLVDLGKIRVRVGLAGAELGRLDEAAPAELRIEDLGGEVFSGRFAAAAPSTDPITGLFDVEYHVDNPERRIRAGMVATAVLPLRSAGERVLIPRAALTRRGGELVVFELVAEPDLPEVRAGREARVARVRTIRTGSYGLDEVEVLDGLAAGALVASSGQHALADGVLVEFDPPP